MGPVLFLLCLLALFVRGEVALVRASLRGRAALRTEVSVGQRAISRKLFLLAGALGGMRIDFHRFHGELPPRFMIVSNHQSLADIPAIAISFPRHATRFVAKRELGRGIPYVSRALRTGEHALVSRTGGFREGQRELRRLAALAEQGIHPVIFPEGTRSRSGRVQEFYHGAIRVVLERCPMPVLSVAVDGGHRIATLTRLLLHLRGTTYRVKPLAMHPAPRGKQDILELIPRLRAEIADQVQRWHRGEEE